jgi:hypothetical protein
MCPFKWTMRTADETRSQAMLIRMIAWLAFTKASRRCSSRFAAIFQGVKLTDEVAKNLARDYLTEIGWFGEESLEADFLF